MLADALIWLDEQWPLLDLPFEVISTMRTLFHYRTGLILGEPRRGRGCWEMGKRLFPRWVGFHPSRCKPSRWRTALYRAASAEAIRQLEEDFGEEAPEEP
jgi:hypothetical protein